MQIVFFTQNKDLLDSLASLSEEKESLWYGQRWTKPLDQSGHGLLFIDFDDQNFELRTFEKLIDKQYPAIRFYSKILISAKLSSREIKKIQGEYSFIDGFIRAPLELKDIQSFIEDFQLVQNEVSRDELKGNKGNKSDEKLFGDITSSKIQRQFDQVFEKNNLGGETAMSNDSLKKPMSQKASKLDLDLDNGLGELEFEGASPQVAPHAQVEPLKAASNNDSFFELDALFEAELENANANALDEQGGTQKTIVYDRSKITSSDIGSFTLNKNNQDNDLTKSSSDVLISRPDIEFTVKDILIPKNINVDKTQEMNISELVEESKKADEADFALNDGFELDSLSLGQKEEHIPEKVMEEEVIFEAPYDIPEIKQQEIKRVTSEYVKEVVEENRPIPQRTHEHSVNGEDSGRIQGTLRQMREEREDLIGQIKLLKGQNRELEQDNLTLKANLDESKLEVSILRKRHLTEVEDLKYQLSLSEEKKVLAEERAKISEGKREKLEQRVRIDLNQVKQREKELESKLEMLSVDVDSQVQSRDQKILELRRKIDSLEFNMGNISLKEQKTQEDKRKLEDKLNKIMKTLRHSIKNLEDDIDQVSDVSQDEAMIAIRRLKA